MGALNRLAAAAWNRARSISLNPEIRANRGQLLYDYLPDPDFEVFGFMDQPGGRIVDVGAHRGHCSLAVLSHTSHLRVIAFEPNEALARPLQWIKRQYPDRFSYHLCALGSRSGASELLVPTSGRKQATTNATMRRSEFTKNYVQERLAEEMGQDFRAIEFPAQTVEMRTLDSFELEPLAIKIDVEGLEREVIEGGRETISRCKPMLMIEMNNQMEFLPLLGSMGYRLYRFDSEQKRLLAISTSETYLNVICLHTDRRIFPDRMIECLPN